MFEIRFIAEDDDDRFLLKRINEIMEVLYFLEAFPIGYWVDEDQTVGPDRSTSHCLFVSWLKKKNGEDYKGTC